MSNKDRFVSIVWLKLVPAKDSDIIGFRRPINTLSIYSDDLVDLIIKEINREVLAKSDCTEGDDDRISFGESIVILGNHKYFYVRGQAHIVNTSYETAKREIVRGTLNRCLCEIYPRIAKKLGGDLC